MTTPSAAASPDAVARHQVPPARGTTNVYQRTHLPENQARRAGRARATLRRGSLAALAAASLAVAGRVAAAQQPTPPDAAQPITLGGAARLAASQSALAAEARFRAQAAQGRVVQARSALMPQVNASYSDGERTFNSASFGLQLPGFDPNGEVIGPVRTVDFRGRVVASLLDPSAVGRWRGAQAAAAGSEAEAAAVAEQTAAMAAGAYLRVLRAEAQVAGRVTDTTLAAELLQIARDQVAAGVGVALDVTRAQAQLAGARAALIAARGERDRSRLDLARALGLPAGTAVTLADSLSDVGLGGVDTDVDVALGKAERARPDLRAAAAAVEAARRAVSAARAERLPTLGVFGDDGATSNTYTHLLNTYTYGLQLSLPVFDGFRRRGQVQEQTAGLREAESRENDLREQVRTDVRGALLDLASAQEQLSAAAERFRLAEQEVAQARERFRAGVAGNADVTTALLALEGSRTQYIDTMTALQAARVAVVRAEGGVTTIP